MTSPTPEPAAAREEIRQLTGLRIVAALWVLSFHFGFTSGVRAAWYWRPFRPVVDAGAIGVDLFYVLSGFVITLTYLGTLGHRPGLRRAVGFWWARICRVWPVYAVATTLFGGWLVAKYLAGARTDYAYQAVQPVLDVPHYLEQLAMMQLWHRPFFDGSSWVGPAWSISAEWLAYVCFPLLALLLWRLRGLRPALAGPAAVLAVVPLGWIAWSTGTIYHPWSWLLRIGAGFLAGALTCLFVQGIRRTPRVDRVAAGVAVLAVGGILTGLFWLPVARPTPAGYTGMAVVVLFPVLVGALALSERGLSRLLATRPAVHGGRISYSLYLVHVPVLEVFWTGMGMFPAFAPGRMLFRVTVPLVLLVIVLGAHLFYRWLEEPARRLLRVRGPGAWARREPRVREVVAAEAPEPVDRAAPDTSRAVASEG